MTLIQYCYKTHPIYYGIVQIVQNQHITIDDCEMLIPAEPFLSNMRFDPHIILKNINTINVELNENDINLLNSYRAICNGIVSGGCNLLTGMETAIQQRHKSNISLATLANFPTNQSWFNSQHKLLRGFMQKDRKSVV